MISTGIDRSDPGNGEAQLSATTHNGNNGKQFSQQKKRKK